MRAVFIDRDGTMGGGHTVEYPWEYRPYPGTAETFRLLRGHGFAPMIFTNQSCIARGKDAGYDFAGEFAAIGAQDWFICLHDDGGRCFCRKPQPGLLYQARDKYGLQLSRSFVIGDRWSDMAAGGKAGCGLILVRTGRGRTRCPENGTNGPITPRIMWRTICWRTLNGCAKRPIPKSISYREEETG